MPVIGRLDRQVEDVIIGPVGGRGGRREEAGAAAPSPARPREVGETDGAAPRDEGARPRDDSPSPRAAGDPARPGRKDGGSLPVWLL